MEIKVLGAGCSRCKKALDVVNNLTSSLKKHVFYN